MGIQWVAAGEGLEPIGEAICIFIGIGLERASGFTLFTLRSGRSGRPLGTDGLAEPVAVFVYDETLSDGDGFGVDVLPVDVFGMGGPLCAQGGTHEHAGAHLVVVAQGDAQIEGCIL